MVLVTLYKIMILFQDLSMIGKIAFRKNRVTNIVQNHFCLLSLRYYSNHVIWQCSLWLVFASLFRVAWNFLLQCKLDDQGYRVSQNLSKKAITCNLDIYFR